MSIRNRSFGVNSVMVSDLIRYDSLLRNVTDVITKCDSYFITKPDRSLLQNASGSLLQNPTVITKCDDFITKCDSYYKMRRLLQIATVQMGVKVNSRNTKTSCEICSNSIIKIIEWRQPCCSVFCIVNFV